jgi:hypothetical protein
MNDAALGLNVKEPVEVRAGNRHRLIRGSLGFAFAHRDDLEIVADRFQNKCFVDRAG